MKGSGVAGYAGHPAKVDALIHSIHAAAGHRHRWRDAIAGLRGLLRGRAAVLARHDFASGRGEWLFESPSNPADCEAYAAEHSARNPWFISSLDYRPGRIMTGEELLASHALRRTDFYLHYLKPHGLLPGSAEWSRGATISCTTQMSCAAVASRHSTTRIGPSSGPYSDT